ncbi:hypothetical protein J4Q44_G00095790 [Coregonus suidteri]|uniref:Uncharacterized protein n=1 Tax=Coregonus suidteri TaxID=861788 RepID=A0AAN8M718_9TELE
MRGVRVDELCTSETFSDSSSLNSDLEVIVKESRWFWGPGCCRERASYIGEEDRLGGVTARALKRVTCPAPRRLPRAPDLLLNSRKGLVPSKISHCVPGEESVRELGADKIRAGGQWHRAGECRSGTA